MSTPANEPTGRGSTRSAVVWSGLESVLHGDPRDVLDIGGGTGGLAVRVGLLGHRVTVVDPSPDALAALDRRAREHDVAVTGRQGDLSSLLDVVAPDSADVVLCHGVLEVVDDPATALATLARVVRPGGVLSLLAAQRHAAVIARAMAGHFQQALALLDPEAASTDPEHRPVPATAVPVVASPTTSSPPWWSMPGSVSTRSTRSGCSPTWSPVRCSTSSRVPRRRWSSWSRPSPLGRSTSRWRPRSICSLTASEGRR